jgi:folylpolyglutamate synthase/dihydropteroate synthase
LAYTTLPLPGEHQIDNLELAIASLMYSQLEISLENVMDGIKKLKSNTDLHTRIELLSTKPMLIIDSSHNEAAVARLIETLDLHLNSKTYDFVFAIMKDKDISKILDIIKPVCRNLIITKPEIDRAANVKDIEELANKKGFPAVAVTTNTKSALSKIDSNYDTIIVGSFYLTGEMIALLNKI